MTPERGGDDRGRVVITRRQLLSLTAWTLPVVGILGAGCDSQAEPSGVSTRSALSEVEITIPTRGLNRLTKFDPHRARHILCFGDSTVEGFVGGFDFWIQLLRERFGFTGFGWRAIWRSEWKPDGWWSMVDWDTHLASPCAAGNGTLQLASEVGPPSGQFLVKIDDELFLVTDGAGTTSLTVRGSQYSTMAADHAVGAPVVNPCSLGPFRYGYAAFGKDSILTWTRPSQGPEEHDQGASFQIAVCCGGLAGGTISTSVDGGSSWQDATVASTGPPSIQLVSPAGASHSTSTIMVRAADARGNPNAIDGIFGAMVFPTPAGQFDNRQTVISNFARSDDLLLDLQGTEVEDAVAHFGGRDGSVVLVTIGPFTNDVEWNEPSNYYANLVDLAKHYSTTSVLIVGAFEQQGIETYSCSMTRNSPDVTLLSPAGNLTQAKDGHGGRDVQVSGYAMGGGGLPYPTTCTTVTGSNSCVLSHNWEAPSGTTELVFSGRDITDQDIFRARARAAAADVGCAYLDLRACWGDFRTAFAAGLMLNGEHQSQKGHRDIAARIQRLVEVLV